jgi:hypothetical protein
MCVWPSNRAISIARATSYVMDSRGFEFQQGQEIFSSPKTSEALLFSAQVPIQLVRKYFAGGKAATRHLLERS